MPDPSGLSVVSPEKWTPVSAGWAPGRIVGDGFAASVRVGLGQTLVSGDLAAAAAALAPGAPHLGLWQAAERLPAFVRIARDRALLLTDAPLGLDEGWRAEGFALSPADDAWAVLEIEGEAAADVIAEATATPFGSASPSASALFAGLPCLLTRAGEGARIHVETAFLPYLWRWLETRVG